MHVRIALLRGIPFKINVGHSADFLALPGKKGLRVTREILAAGEAGGFQKRQISARGCANPPNGSISGEGAWPQSTGCERPL